LSDIQAKGVGLYLHQQGLDTTTPSGKAMFQMMGVFAEFERAMIRERVLAGLARARKDGTQLGRKPLEESDPDKAAAIRKLRSQGVAILKIAQQLGVGTSVVQRLVA
jgi:DNA invertase Pin-like site-specific DNA recombinase